MAKKRNEDIMAKELKYIVFKDPSGMENVILIPAQTGIQHKDIAVYGAKLLAAGFCRLEQDGPVCYGSSISLELGHRKEDEALVKFQYYPRVI